MNNEVEIKENQDKKANIKKLCKKKAKQYIWISLGVVLMDLGYYFFFSQSGIVAGGVTGLEIVLRPLLQNIPWFKPSYFLYGAEVICLILGLIFIGKEFFIKTVYAALLSPTIIFIFETTGVPGDLLYAPISDGNKLIISTICGALLTGFGVGLAIRNNGSTGGMDVIQKIISKYAKIPISQTLIFTDWAVVILSGYSFLTNNYRIEYVVFGILALIAEGYIIDVLALSIRPRRTVYVISDKPQEIKDLIYEKLDRGVTFSPVMGAYTNTERTMVICTMDKNEAYRIVSLISEIDPKAFTFVTSCKEVRGEYDKRGII
ncbi:MAG: YitT family protein [Acholeplasmatales bacterium]|nr:YitT family protein [Acholeplasmatales bacterium]